MTLGKLPERPVRFHTIVKGSQDVELSFKSLTTTKIVSLDKALKVIKGANLPVKVDIAIDLLNEVKRLRGIINRSR